MLGTAISNETASITSDKYTTSYNTLCGSSNPKEKIKLDQSLTGDTAPGVHLVDYSKIETLFMWLSVRVSLSLLESAALTQSLQQVIESSGSAPVKCPKANCPANDWSEGGVVRKVKRLPRVITNQRGLPFYTQPYEHFGGLAYENKSVGLVA